jgi:hypothetical protein
MSELLVAVPSVAFLVSSIFNILGDQLKGFFSRYSIFGICSLSQESIDYIIKNTQADHVQFINLDQEILSELDADDKQRARESGFQLNRVIYTRGKKVVQAVQDILMGSSRAVQTIIFCSSDYHLLKYIGCNKVSYHIPSDNYLKEHPEEKIDPTIRADLLKRKMSKVNIFNHKNEFLQTVCDKFNTKIKI